MKSLQVTQLKLNIKPMLWLSQEQPKIGYLIMVDESKDIIETGHKVFFMVLFNQSFWLNIVVDRHLRAIIIVLEKISIIEVNSTELVLLDWLTFLVIDLLCPWRHDGVLSHQDDWLFALALDGVHTV